eukprot:gene34242-biopygen22056
MMGGVLNLKFPARGFWPDEMRNWHITHLELEAVYKTVQVFLKELEGKVLPRYYAAWKDPKCEGVDSLTYDWRGENNWVNLPWALLDEVAHKLREEGAAATVVALYWPGQSWFRELEALATEINVALEAKVAAKSGTSDPDTVANTAEQLLERRRKQARTMLELRGQLEQEPGSSQRGGSDALRAKLQFVEDRVYQAADGVVADEVLRQWLNDFDKNRVKAMLNFTSKNAANSDARVVKDHRDQRWKERKKYDEEKDGKKPTAKGSKGRGAKPAADA